MIELSREQHCALAGLNVQAFKTLQRYNRVPEIGAGLRASIGFSPLETLALMIAIAFRDIHHQSHAQAAHQASKVEKILPFWLHICEASKPPVKEILFGRVYFAGMRPPEDVCGTLDEIAAEHPYTTASVTISVSRVVAQMRLRAEKLNIDLNEFCHPGFVPSCVAPTPKSHPSKRRSK